jgi:hypothetical protein
VSFDDPHDRLRQLVEPTRRGISDFERGRARKLGLGLLLGLLPRMSLVLVIGYWGLVLISGREPFSPFVLPALLALALLAGFAALWMRAQRIEASPARAAARVDREFDLQGRSAAGLEFSKDPAEDLPRRVRAFRRLAVEDALAHAGRVQGAAAAIRRGVPPCPGAWPSSHSCSASSLRSYDSTPPRPCRIRISTRPKPAHSRAEPASPTKRRRSSSPNANTRPRIVAPKPASPKP